MEYVLVTRGLIFSYENGTSFDFPDIDCEKGRHLLIMGPSGCGKTTLLHLLAGLLNPSSGSVTIAGTDITKLHESLLDKYRGKEIGVVFQKPHFVQALSVIDNIRLVPYLNHKTISDQTIKDILQRLNLADKCDERVNRLSEGEKQRLSIARAMINNPVLILADEPTSSLDDNNCEESLKLLKSQAEITGASLIIVTHDKRLLGHFQNIITL
ncbi:ATP-binding cassette domain-containing protein [Massilibacteroides sp.]|uniref:ABC transporter ATP-binding protein n=1 Tax=Massilibacteroides sp. TaxID=2034766 RepID=UPI0026213999|nr:ATP-binding cassette domain-containing protein [Massilibacteroides sp.]MDD4514688.1 ATP-binding cassette domain-containing protein [Massilibacteroides sp.]